MDQLEKGCAQWRESLSALVDGELPFSEQRAVWEHLRGCASCRAYYRQLSALQRRLHRTDPVTLWLRTLRANRWWRRALVASVMLTALLSAGATAFFVHRWWYAPAMTPIAAAGLFNHHAAVPPEWQANPSCAVGIACLGERTATAQPQFIALPRWGRLERAGVCECLGVPIALYQLTVQRSPVLLLQFNTDQLPLQAPAAERLVINGQPLTCTVVADTHVLMWQRGKQGFALVAPFGKVNLFQVFHHIAPP
ncbi:hypothetical protein HRbin17_00633 [bacterium HR17]|uniref:Putative zinc-finger domain-containing protein n=1 Tax=Candidatus Fervidibacter japonicus TaxID=2035412 RepID=A0A2H5XAB4_9BACT|nr:hypothetical protein HRbin17_00633 [bacterium HR17]